jgi:hypothetical protein
MGYPMTYERVVRRNNLGGDYPNATPAAGEGHLGCIRGDMRRLESDSRDEHHLQMYAKTVGITVEQAKAVLDLFFEATQGRPFSQV